MPARLKFLESLTSDEATALYYDWSFWARPEQLPPPGDWHVWLVLAGRGFGKTRTGAEWISSRAKSGFRRFALIAETAADARDVMVEGETGVLAVSPPTFMPHYEPSKRRLTWPNGAIASTFSGDEPDQLRGPQFDSAWADEPAKWKYGSEAWDNLEFGLRMSAKPQAVATGTPKPVKLIKDLMGDPQTVKTGGNTYANMDNLPASFIHRVVSKYEGTRLGQQELHAQLLEDNPGALWKRSEMIDAHRVATVPDLIRIVVGVDPEATSGESSAETGIVVAGIDRNDHGYVLDDMTLMASPNGWATQVVAAYTKYRANRIIAEINNGGEMVENTIRVVSKNVSYKGIHASRGKVVRAEPIATLYERGMVHHVGTFADLEDQMCQWTPGDKSPDRLDALVWALTELMLDDTGEVAHSVSPLKGYRG